jgi:hypothetical protein
MSRAAGALVALLSLWIAGNPLPQRNSSRKIAAGQYGFPCVVRVRLWYLHPPPTLKLVAE